MAITIVIDNDTSTTNTFEDLILDESGGLQTSGTTDKGNDSNLDFTDPTVVVGNTPDSDLDDGTLSGASVPGRDPCALARRTARESRGARRARACAGRSVSEARDSPGSRYWGAMHL